jgi:predicted outer membrane repeat protein
MSFILMIPVPALAATYVVNPDGTGDFPTIQAAIDAAANGDIIELTDGTFIGDGNRDVDLLGKAVCVRSQSGNPDACVVDCGGDPEDHRAFLIVTGEGNDTVIEGLTITHGHAELGGAVTCNDSAPTIRRCTFVENSAAESGGAISGRGEHPLGMPLVIEDCIFRENSSSSYDGAIGASCDLSVSGCTFEANTAGWAGAIYLLNDHGVDFTVTDCAFVENSGDYGTVLVEEASSAGSTMISSCSFVRNEGRSGGACGVYSYGHGEVTLSECLFWDNVSSECGGALYLLTYVGAEVPLVDHCTFFGNAAPHGGTIYGVNEGGDHPVVQNSIIAFGSGGEAIDGWSPMLTCCDIYGNEGGDWVGAIADQYGINGNISLDPLFCAPGNGDFTLHQDSPCAPFTPPNEECDLIGAWPVGCGPTAVRMRTWGAIKALFGSGVR